MIIAIRALAIGALAASYLSGVSVAQQALASPYEKSQPKKVRLLDKGASRTSPSPSLEGKKVLTSEAYDLWRTIADPILSADGLWAAYTLSSRSGAAELIVRSTRDATEFRIPKHKPSAQFSADSRFLIFTLLPSASEIPTLDSKAVTLGLLRLPQGTLTKITKVPSFAPPRTSGAYVAYMLTSDGVTSPPDDLKKAERGGTLVLRHLAAGTETRIPDVAEFRLDDAATFVAYLVSSADEGRNGAYVRRLLDGASTPLLKGPGRYRGLTLDLHGRQLAFLADQHERMTGSPETTLYYARLPFKQAEPVVSKAVLPDTSVISPNARVAFTRSGKALTFEVSSRATAPPTAENEAEFELWTWQDPKPLPQGARAEPAQSNSALAVYQIANRRYMRLGAKDVQLTDDARYAITLDGSPYEFRHWKQGKRRADVSILDVLTGKSRLLHREWDPSWLLSRVADQSGYRFAKIEVSPGGRYLAYFENQRWFSYHLEGGKTVDLTRALPSTTRFQLPHTWGMVAGWTSGDQRVLIYDEYDIWLIDPSGVEVSYNLTQGIRGENDIIFRLWDDAALLYIRGNYGLQLLHRPEPTIDTSQPLLLAAYNKRSRASSVWRIVLGARTATEKLFEADKHILPVAQAREAQQHLFTLQTFTEFPDLWTTSRFAELKRMSDANPQQKEYRWGTEEPFEFKNREGVPITKGVLYKPEGFDPAKKYPMIVGIYVSTPYEVPLGRYKEPNLLTGAYDRFDSPTRFVSNGYVVFHPEVADGTPYVYVGQSALNTIAPAVQAVIDRGFIDPARIAISGHSFGGYQTAYTITQTHLFRCAIIGAAVFNPISNYGSHHGANFVTGRPGFYETTQGGMNFGASIWEKSPAYQLNSPLAFADRIQTPLLLFHNDGETIVPFTQAVEFVNALRRNEKEAYLFNYKGENHALIKRANILDWDARVYGFLDHHLKDAPRPNWMSP